MASDREIAYQILLEIETKGAYSNIELKNAMLKGNIDSEPFVRELVYGVIENKLYLDYILDQLIDKGIKSVDIKVLIMIRLGIFQIIFMNSVPDYAAVNETVNFSKKILKGRDKFVNAIMRAYIRNRNELKLPDREENIIKYLSIRYSCDESIIKMLIEQYGLDNAKKYLKFVNTSPPLFIRINISKITPHDFKKELEAENIEFEDSNLSNRCLDIKASGITNLTQFKDGKFSIQSEESCMIVDMLKVKPSDTVIDVCAAPGGKTLAIAEEMSCTGSVLAFDKYKSRIKLIDKEAKRLDLECIKTQVADAKENIKELIGKADCVLVDAPCSGLGVVRRKPEIKYKDFSDSGKVIASEQLSILNNVSKYVKKGGKLLYSTCTINKFENEDVIKKFLQSHDNFEKTVERLLLPFRDGKDGFYACLMKCKA